LRKNGITDYATSWQSLAAADVSDFDTTVTNNTAVAANTTARHTHANKALLDTYTQTEANLADAVVKKHSHSNQATLDATTASFTTADETKLDGIEAAADVTDATNVDAAGAVMNSDTSTAAMSFVVDEDDMTSDSATKVPTQQSVKAYVDANISGDVTGPAASADNGVPRYDSTTGKLLQTSTATIDDTGNLTLAPASGVAETSGGLNFPHTNGTGTSKYRLSQDSDDILNIKRTGDTTGDGAVFSIVNLISPSATTSGDSEATYSLSTRTNGTGSITRTLDVYNDEYGADNGMGLRQLYKNTTPNPIRFESHDKTTNNGAWTMSGASVTSGSPNGSYTSVSGVTPSAEDWIWDNALAYIGDDTKILSINTTAKTFVLNRNAVGTGSGLSIRGKNIREIARLTALRQLLVRKFIASSSTNVAEFGGQIQVDGKIIGLTDPTGAQDAATKAYVDATAGGTGDVTGPASSVDSEIALFSSTSGKVIKRASVTGLLKAASGVLSAASAGTDYYAPGSTDVAIGDGGTGASTAASARTNLGLTAGGQSTYVVATSGGDYTDIQSALDAIGSSGGTIYIADGTYTVTSTLLIKRSRTRIFAAGGAIIQCDGSTVTTLIKPNTTGLSQITIDGGKWLQTNATVQGIGFDFSDSSNCWIRNMRIELFGTALQMIDTISSTFYNSVRDSVFFDCNNGISLGGSQANMNEFNNVRIRPKAGGAGTGIALVDARGCTFIHCDIEPGTATGITGISVDATSRETVFTNCWVENNATGVSVASGANRITFVGCSITANTSNLSDSGTNTVFINTSIGGTTKNQYGSATITGGTITGITDVTVADGGTGASNASGARTNLGLVIGTDIEAHDADLTTIAGLSPANDDVLQRKSGTWTNRTMAQVKTDLALTKSDVGLGSVTNDAQLKAADLDTDGTLAANSDAKIASQKAVKTYADTGLATKETVSAWSTWVPTETGFSAAPASGLYRYRTVGDEIEIEIVEPNDGTSNASGFTVTLPVTAATVANMEWVGMANTRNNSAYVNNPSLAVIASAGTILTFYISPNRTTTWGTTGGKRCAYLRMKYRWQ
jgi:hypothetical protein